MMSVGWRERRTRRERLKSALYLSKNVALCQKNVKGGTLLDLLTYILLQNFKQLEGGPFEDIKKFSKKNAQCRKNPKGDPLGTPNYVGFLAKIKNERRTIWTVFALALGGFRIVSEKWTDQCDDCSLKKKEQDGNVPSRRHILGSKIFKEQLL